MSSSTPVADESPSTAQQRDKDNMIKLTETNWGSNYIEQYIPEMYRHKHCVEPSWNPGNRSHGIDVPDNSGSSWPLPILSAIYKLSCIEVTRGCPENIRRHISRAVGQRIQTTQQRDHEVSEEDLEAVIKRVEDIQKDDHQRLMQRSTDPQVAQNGHPGNLHSFQEGESGPHPSSTGETQSELSVPAPQTPSGEKPARNMHTQEHRSPHVNRSDTQSHVMEQPDYHANQSSNTVSSMVQARRSVAEAIIHPPSCSPRKSLGYAMGFHDLFGYFHGPYGHEDNVLNLSSYGSLVCGFVTDVQTMRQCGKAGFRTIGYLKAHIRKAHQLMLRRGERGNYNKHSIAAHNYLRTYYAPGGGMDQTKFDRQQDLYLRNLARVSFIHDAEQLDAPDMRHASTQVHAEPWSASGSVEDGSLTIRVPYVPSEPSSQSPASSDRTLPGENSHQHMYASQGTRINEEPIIKRLSLSPQSRDSEAEWKRKKKRDLRIRRLQAEEERLALQEEEVSERNHIHNINAPQHQSYYLDHGATSDTPIKID